MKANLRELHNVLVDLYIMMNQPKRDTALLEEAGVTLDRALFPLLVGIEKKGPVGVVELADMIGRDHTTVSRQVSKLEELGLVKRQISKNDSRVKETSITSKGRELTDKISVAREARAKRALAGWSKKDLAELTQLMRRFANDLQSKS